MFFGLDNLTVTLSYQKQGNDAAYTGTQTYSQEILGVSNPRFRSSTTTQRTRGRLVAGRSCSRSPKTSTSSKKFIDVSNGTNVSCGNLARIALQNVKVQVTTSLKLTSRPATAGTRKTALFSWSHRYLLPHAGQQHHLHRRHPHRPQQRWHRQAGDRHQLQHVVSPRFHRPRLHRVHRRSGASSSKKSRGADGAYHRHGHTGD